MWVRPYAENRLGGGVHRVKNARKPAFHDIGKYIMPYFARDRRGTDYGNGFRRENGFKIFHNLPGRLRGYLLIP